MPSVPRAPATTIARSFPTCLGVGNAEYFADGSMAFARFSGDSDVYVYADTRGGFTCAGCPTAGEERRCTTAEAMVTHLLSEHRAKGQRVPDDAITALQAKAAAECDAPWPSRESMLRAAALAGIAHEDWMQDWPIEVADANRLDEFVVLLHAKRDDWELSCWFLDLVLDSARMREDLPRWRDALVEALVGVWHATKAPQVRERLDYWACAESDLEDAFEVSPLVREALRQIDELSTER